jgi:hypothetical protein
MTGVRLCSPVERNLVPILTCGNSVVLDNRPADEVSVIGEPIPAALRPGLPQLQPDRSSDRIRMRKLAPSRRPFSVLMRPLAHEAIAGTSSSNEP